MLYLRFKFTVLQEKEQQPKLQIEDITPRSLTDATAWNGPGSLAREKHALYMVVERLDGYAANGEMVALPYYNTFSFRDERNNVIAFPVAKDGVYRFTFVVVPWVVTPADFAAVQLNQAFAWQADNSIRVKRSISTASEQKLLEGPQVLGLTNDEVAFAAQATFFQLWDAGLREAKARLNLRYLQQPESQQQPLIDLYRRIDLQHEGILELCRQGRYLDAVAVLEGARLILVTNGQTPDAYGPMLSGYSSTH